MTKQTDEIAELKRKVAALEAAQPKPEPPPFIAEPYQRFDPTARMSMPRSTMRDMITVDYDPRQDAGAYRHVHSHAGVIPAKDLPRERRVAAAGDGTGWARETPLANPPGVNWADRLMDHQDNLDRAELVERLAKQRAVEEAMKPK